MNRKQRKALAQETLQIIEAGGYEVEGRRVDIRDDLSSCAAATVEFTNIDPAPSYAAQPGVETSLTTANETTLDAASRLHAAGRRVAVLNFASAKNPGGGFLSGSLAQEESLAVASGLYACLKNRQMYAYHRPTTGGMYTPWVIYSPDVPVFRDPTGALLGAPYRVAFLTAPAPNAGVVRTRTPARSAEIRAALQERIDKVLSVAAHFEHDALVLGAWGCGVFKNDPEEVAELFAEALSQRFAGRFDKVAFAVLDGTPDHRIIEPFRRRFPA